MGISLLNRTKRDGHASLAMTATGTAVSSSNHRLRRSVAPDDGKVTGCKHSHFLFKSPISSALCLQELSIQPSQGFNR